jgi:hypothetical protein
LQLFESLVGSTQLPLQSIGAADGHPDTHEYTPAEPAHTLALLPQTLPQLPQLAAVVYRAQAPPQRLYPGSHPKAQVPSVQAGWELATVVVHTVPHIPQFEGLVRSTHSLPHAASPSGQPPSGETATASSPESAAPS